MRKLLKFKERILTVLDAPEEGDFFECLPNYDSYVKVILNKEIDHGYEKEVRKTYVQTGKENDFSV